MAQTHEKKMPPQGLAPLLNDVARLFARYWDYRARLKFGYTRMHCSVLVALFRRGPQRQVDLAERMELTPMALTGLIDRMTEKGLIRRADDPADRRSYLLMLSDKAKDDSARVITEALSADAELFRGFSAAEKRTLRDMLERMKANIAQAELQYRGAPVPRRANGQTDGVRGAA